MARFPIKDEYLSELVSEYMAVMGCGNSLKNFTTESGIAGPAVDVVSLSVRSRIRAAVCQGLVDKAVRLIEEYNPKVDNDMGVDGRSLM